MILRVLTKDDAPEFSRLRLQAIKDSPIAFLQTESEFRSLTDLEVEQWISPNENKITIGAFDDDGRMLGMAGLKRELGIKVSHKAFVWGVFVTPEARGTRIAYQMMQMIIEEAKKLPELIKLILKVSDRQIQAKKLYSSLGFIQYGKEMKAVKIDNCYYDELLMCLDL